MTHQHLRSSEGKVVEISAPNKQAAKKDDFQRNAVLREANDARGKGKRKRAVELYRQILAHDPEDFEVHGKLAQLLAEGGEIDEARKSFHAGAEGYHKKGFTDRAIALLHQAVQAVPTDVDGWLRISDLQIIRLKKADAANTLANGRKIFRKRKHLAAAAQILQAHMQLEPTRMEIVIDLAQVEKKRGNKPRSIELLESTMPGVNAFDRKKLRKALFFVAPSPRTLWRWFKNTKPAAPANRSVLKA